MIRSYLIGQRIPAAYTMYNLVTNIMNWTSANKIYKGTVKNMASGLWTDSSMSTTSHFGKEVGYNRVHYHFANLGSIWMAAECLHVV